MGESRIEKFVLIVEDDATLAEAWRAKLKSGGYDVAVCRQIDSGLEACKNQWPDLVVLDGFFLDQYGIPKSEGAVKFCAQAERYAAAQKKEMPVIIGVTGVRPTEGFNEDVFSPISLNVMSARMRKPFEPASLLYEIERAFAQACNH